jgi:hypothetical protein
MWFPVYNQKISAGAEIFCHYCVAPAPAGAVAPPPPYPPPALPVLTWIVCAVTLPSELVVPPTITLVPTLSVLGETVVGSVTGVELEKNTTSEFPFASWSVMLEESIAVICPVTSPPPVAPAPAARRVEEPNAPAPPANADCRLLAALAFPQ